MFVAVGKETWSIVLAPPFANGCRNKVKKRRSYRIQSTGGTSSVDVTMAGSESLSTRHESMEREKKETSPVQASTGSSSRSSQNKTGEFSSASPVSKRDVTIYLDLIWFDLIWFCHNLSEGECSPYLLYLPHKLTFPLGIRQGLKYFWPTLVLVGLGIGWC